MPIMERLFLSLFVLCTISFVFCFKNYGLGNILINSGNVNAQYSISRANADRSLHMAISSASLVRKNKFKEIEILKKNISESGGEDAITKFLTTGERPYGSNQPVPFRNSILNKYKTVSVMAEYNRKAKTGFILGLPPPEITGGILRDAGAKAIVASMDKRVGNIPPNEFYRLCREQYTARKFVPSSISVVWNDYIVDDIQIIQAASLGAAAVILDPDVLEGDLAQKIAVCKKYDLEPLVYIKNFEEGKAAFDAGATVVIMRNLNEEGFINLKNELLTLPSSENHVYIAKLRAQSDFSVYSEIDVAWVLRDHGFHCVWPSPEAVFATGVSDIYCNIIAFKSKASRLFLSPRQFLMDRNKEGAKEFLGNIYF